MNIPALADFLAAHPLIRGHIAPTPLVPIKAPAERYSLRLFGKQENLSPIRSFKLRGALYRAALVPEEQRQIGLVTSSTGNHGMGLAFAARAFGIRATIVVPDDAPAVKVDRIIDLGGEVRRCGHNLTEAELAARELASERGAPFVEDGNDRGLMIGAGTIALEVMHDLPATDVLVVPVGGGNLIAGVAACAKALKPEIRVIGVQSEAAPSVYESWRARRLVRVECTTFAGGLATDHPGELALAVILDTVDDIVLVSEEALRTSTAHALLDLGQVLEGAGAASLAAVERYGEAWRGQTVVALLTGGNASAAELAAAVRVAGW